MSMMCLNPVSCVSRHVFCPYLTLCPSAFDPHLCVVSCVDPVSAVLQIFDQFLRIISLYTKNNCQIIGLPIQMFILLAPCILPSCDQRMTLSVMVIVVFVVAIGLAIYFRYKFYVETEDNVTCPCLVHI